MNKKFLVLGGILLIGAVILTSCSTTVTTTQIISTTTVTVPATTYTQTVNQADAKSFIAGIEKAYSQGANGQGGAVPGLIGISEPEFSSLKIQNDSVISMNGTSYNYVAMRPFTSTSWDLPAEVTLNNYQIDFAVPDVLTTGGRPISVQIFNHGTTGIAFGTTFIYYYIPVVVTTRPLYVEMRTLGDLKFLFMYYYPSSSGQIEDDMWFILQPDN